MGDITKKPSYNWKRRAPATEKQIAYLLSFDPPVTGLTKGQIGKLISVLEPKAVLERLSGK